MFLKLLAEVAVLVVSNCSGIHFAGFAGLHAPRAMLLTFGGRSAALVVYSGSGILLWFCWYFRTLRCVPDDCRQVPQLLLALDCPVPGQGC